MWAAHSGDEWMAGVFLEWSLFEGGITRAQVAKARARYREIEWNDKAYPRPGAGGS